MNSNVYLHFLTLGEMHLANCPKLRSTLQNYGMMYIVHMFNDVERDACQDINEHLRNCKIDFLKSELVSKIVALTGYTNEYHIMLASNSLGYLVDGY